MSPPLEAPRITTDREVIEAFAEERKRRAPIPVRVACWLGIAGFASYIAADIALVEGSLKPLLIARGLIVGANLLVFLLSFTDLGKRYIHVLAVISCLAMGFGVSALTAMTGGAASRYHEALLLVLIGFSLLIPWGPVLAGATFVACVASYDVILLALNLNHPVGTWVVNNFILWAGVVICTVGVLVAERLRRIEFQNRFRLKVANDELSSALDKLKELDRLKTRFFANVSHELRTPLMLIMGPLESLLEQPLEPSRRELMETMMANARRLLRQVNTILDAAKLEAGRLRVNLQHERPGALLANLVASARPHAEARQIELVDEGLDAMPEARLDAEKLEVIAANLVSNALKFTPAGGKVTVRGGATAREYFFSVEDTGPGIPTDQVERIFERFYQVDASANRHQEGTGLGLALTRELVTLHGGTLEVSSTEGQGSTFSVSLPIDPKNLAEERRRRYRRREDQLAATRLETVAATHFTATKEQDILLADLSVSQLPTTATLHPSNLPAGSPRILLVEDNADLRAFLARSLAEEYRIITAADGQEGLLAAQRYKPNLIVTDIMMPRMNGYELCQHIREDPILAPIPVILVTAKSGSDALVEGLSVGADDYVTKPFDLRELRARIAAQLRAKSLERRLSERESRLTALGQMVAAILTDIRNPLTTIFGYAEMAKLSAVEGAKPEELVEEIQTLLQEARRLQRMLSEIGEYASVGALALQRAQTPVYHFLKATLPLLNRELEQSNIAFHSRLDLDENLTLPLDRERIHHALENLVTNARNALCSQNGAAREPQVWLEAKIDGHDLMIRIADNGPGIPEEMTGRLFEPFASTGIAPAAGLGLVTVRNMMLAHGGDVHVEQNAPEGGAAFTLRIPCQEGEAPA
ncbi:MAG: response regulator [Bradymonadales bacterium]|nr:response regulator [Bradymonadales bacterium]